MSPVHSHTGLRYINVFPTAMSYRDVLESYKNHARHSPWMEVYEAPAWEAVMPEILDDPHAAVTIWGGGECAIPKERKCMAAIHYGEMHGALPAVEAASVDQFRTFTAFLDKIGSWDLIFVDSPTGTQMLSKLTRVPVRFVPAGYDVHAMGHPNWDTVKTNWIGYYGFTTGHRQESIQKLSRALPNYKIVDLSGTYGAERARKLSQCVVNLCVLHGQDLSFPSFRIWQSIASSSIFVSETGDVWPAVPGRHCILMPPITDSTIKECASILSNVLDRRVELKSMAQVAHQELSKFTIERIVHEYVMPAFAEVKK